MEPISRSAYAFCHGERGAVRISSMPKDALAGYRDLDKHPPARLVGQKSSRFKGAEREMGFLERSLTTGLICSTW